MAYGSGYSAKGGFEYRKASVGGASPVGLIVMLYDGALRFMERGKAAVAAHDLPAQNEALQRAQKIVLELMGALDMRKGGDVASNLMALYSYVLEQLIAANCEDRIEPIDNAIRTMSELRLGWVELERNLKEQQGEDQSVGTLMQAA